MYVCVGGISLRSTGLSQERERVTGRSRRTVFRWRSEGQQGRGWGIEGSLVLYLQRVKAKVAREEGGEEERGEQVERAEAPPTGPVGSGGLAFQAGGQAAWEGSEQGSGVNWPRF